MASTYSDLKFELIGTGEQAGTWGTTTNTNLGTAIEQAIVGKADVTMSGTPITLTLTNSNAAQDARAIYLNLTGSPGGAAVLEVPAIQKPYIVKNGTTGGFAVTVKVTGQTGVSVPNGKTMWLYNNGTDVTNAIDNLPSGATVGGVAISTASGTVTSVDVSGGTTGLTTSGGPVTGSGTITIAGTLAVANGGTGTATPALVQGANVTITGTWPNQTIAAAAPGTGTVTAVSVVSANGLAGTSSGGATPALTLSTSVTGVLKGNGTAISAATAGTDYVAPGTATTFTATQTFSGTSSALGIVLNDAAEVTTISATAATGTINYDITTQSVLYFTTNASGNFTVNFRASSGTSLDTAMSTGQSVTVAFLVTNGATAYYNSAVQVDGNAVTPKWQGGTAPTAGNASSVDSYVYTIVKTGSATFTVFAAQTQFA
jgi:hypothetical protein